MSIRNSKLGLAGIFAGVALCATLKSAPAIGADSPVARAETAIDHIVNNKNHICYPEFKKSHAQTAEADLKKILRHAVSVKGDASGRKLSVDEIETMANANLGICFEDIRDGNIGPTGLLVRWVYDENDKPVGPIILLDPDSADSLLTKAVRQQLSALKTILREEKEGHVVPPKSPNEFKALREILSFI